LQARVKTPHTQLLQSSTHSRCRPGCGPDLLWYELPSGDLRCTAQLFAGARVHGLRAAGERGLVAHGGRRVATFALERRGSASAAVRLAAALPSFAAWVLDARPLRGDDEPPDAAQPPTLLAGAATTCLLLAGALHSPPRHVSPVALSDNSVELWCTASCTRRWRSVCAERALLYSAALCGDTPASLRCVPAALLHCVQNGK
jgi:hypothetical protein